MTTFNIMLNSNRRVGTMHKETRELVLKNFPDYNHDDLYCLDRLSCGLQCRIDESENYMLFKSTCSGDDRYVVFNKVTKSICLELEICVYDKHSICLDKETETLKITFSEFGSSWRIGNYALLDHNTYKTYLRHDAHPFVGLVNSDDVDFGYMSCSDGLYITEKIVDNIDDPTLELKSDKWKTHIIFFGLF